MTRIEAPLLEDLGIGWLAAECEVTAFQGLLEHFFKTKSISEGADVLRLVKVPKADRMWLIEKENQERIEGLKVEGLLELIIDDEESSYFNVFAAEEEED